MEKYFDIAFTPSVTEVQERKGARRHYDEAARSWPVPSQLNGPEVEHIVAADSLYLSSVGESGWPYVQHRGGERGFVKILDDHSIGWVERRGNRQYLSAGNIAADDRVAIIMVDYPKRTRLKLFGHAVYHPDPSSELLARLGGQDLRGDGVITITVASYDWNCPKYITPRHTDEAVEAITAPLRTRIAELEAKLAAPTGTLLPDLAKT